MEYDEFAGSHATDLGLALTIVEEYIAGRPNYVDPHGRNVSWALDLVLTAARKWAAVSAPQQEDHDQDHGVAGEWDEPGSGQPITETNP